MKLFLPKKDTKTGIPENDSFLKGIQGQIRMLGYAAIGALLLIGVTGLLTLWRSNTNNRVLNYMNSIANYQYNLDSYDDDALTSSLDTDSLLGTLRDMKQIASDSLDMVYSSTTKNNIQKIYRNIEHLEDNYRELIALSNERGYVSTQGLYKEYQAESTPIFRGLMRISAGLDTSEINLIRDYYNISKELSDYSSSVMDETSDSYVGQKIYQESKAIENTLLMILATRQSQESFTQSELYSDTIEHIRTSNEILSKMISIDSKYIIIDHNNEQLFEQLLRGTNSVRTMEEENTSTEQNSLIALMVILVIVLVIYMALLTFKLRRDLSRSIRVFNDLMVVKASNDAQSSFLSTVSHEIRTPINAIMGMNEIIIRESKDKQIERYAREIKDSSRTLLSLVNDLLDSSRLDADKLKIIPVEYDLSSSISDLTNMIRSRAKDKNLSFIVNVDPNIPHMLFGDEIRVKQCALNLLTNAVKYTETGSITLNVDYETVNRGSILLRFQVIDTGIGMKEEDLTRLFDRFARFEEKKNRNIEGTGLGMNIVKRLLTLMGSDLEVHSIYGKGSDFSFSVHQGVISWEPLGDYNAMYEKSLLAEAAYHEKLRAPAAHILIVDDMKVNLTVFKGLLKKTQINIDTALSGKTALELIKKNKYDMVFLDHRMPKMDGIETLASIRELSNNPNLNIPYIALTANAIAGARELYINIGFTDYLSKPIDSNELEEILVEYLPKELIEITTEDDFSSEEQASSTAHEGNISDNYIDDEVTDPSAPANDEDKLHSVLQTLDGIDYASGIENCLDDETLSEAISDFIQSIETKPDEIEGYRAAGDLRNYTIQVHGLKSTARLIGAVKLSEDAYHLEQCGDNADKDEIDAKTPALLELYRSYLDKLRPFIELTSPEMLSDSDTDSSEEDGEGMDEAMFNDALSSVRELVDSFDFGNAEEILKMMRDYPLSHSQKDAYNTLYKMVRDVDRDAVLAWFEK